VANSKTRMAYRGLSFKHADGICSRIVSASLSLSTSSIAPVVVSIKQLGPSGLVVHNIGEVVQSGKILVTLSVGLVALRTRDVDSSPAFSTFGSSLQSLLPSYCFVIWSVGISLIF
jgi:hypothetical protein